MRKIGLTGVGIKTVAEACGCNSATLYQYFGESGRSDYTVYRILYGEGGG